MNFFKLYIGDYQRDTAHLSITEHGAYMLMLQHYYATEKPLPTGKALHRMLRAQDKSERDAIDTVSAQFWHTTETGLVNGRADKEVARASTQADTNRSTAQAREEARKVARDEHERSTNRATNDSTKVAPRARNHSQTPDTNSVAELPRGESAASAPRRPAKKPPADFEPTSELRQWAAENAPEVPIDPETAKFRDHTFSRAITDWPGTWRNWMRRAAEGRPVNGTQAKPERHYEVL